MSNGFVKHLSFTQVMHISVEVRIKVTGVSTKLSVILI